MSFQPFALQLSTSKLRRKTSLRSDSLALVKNDVNCDAITSTICASVNLRCAANLFEICIQPTYIFSLPYQGTH